MVENEPKAAEEIKESAQILEKKEPFNVILMGIPGSGKTDVGWYLSRLLGYGFCELEREVEKIEKKSFIEILSNDGVAVYQEKERNFIKNMGAIKNHVIATSFYSAMDLDNWKAFKTLGTIVWIDCQPEEVAARFLKNKQALNKHPDLKRFSSIENKVDFLANLSESLKSIAENLKDMIKDANFTVEDQHGMAGYTADVICRMLLKEKLVRTPSRGKPLYRWK